MDSKTVKRLLQLNQDFYRLTASEFDSTRQSSWPGWEKVIDDISKSASPAGPIHILDLGCGNARFFTALQKRLTSLKFTYTGIDFSPELLEKARARLSDQAIIIELIQANLLSNLNELKSNKFDFIVAFGVLHHIPGEQNRLRFLQKMSRFLNPQGAIWLTVWDFMQDSRFSKKLVNPSKTEFSQDLLEQNDYFLGWNAKPEAVRYCHYTTEEEILQLANASSLQITRHFLADGATNRLNRYYKLQKMI